MTTSTLSLASFFTIEAREYTNFTVDADARAMIRNLIIAFAVGVVLASVYAFYQKNVPGAFVHALLRAEAFSKESAKTVAELGFGKHMFVLFELKHNTMLKRVIACTEPDETTDEATFTPAYYIPEDLKYRAEVRYEKKGNGPMALIITAVVTVLVAILLIRLMPLLLTVADNILK